MFPSYKDSERTIILNLLSKGGNVWKILLLLLLLEFKETVDLFTNPKILIQWQNINHNYDSQLPQIRWL